MLDPICMTLGPSVRIDRLPRHDRGGGCGSESHTELNADAEPESMLSGQPE